MIKKKTLNKIIPYGRQSIDDSDIDSIVKILKSDWLTTGPNIEKFELAFAKFTGSKYAVAVNSGTAALHSAMHAINIKPDDEVLVPTMTFAATANCVLYKRAKPVFIDVNPNSLLIDTNDLENKINENTKAIIVVDYAGQPVEYDIIQDIASKYKIKLIADSCHAIGGHYKTRPIGSIADLSTFSFHPVKNMTTGEGGMITTNNKEFSERMRTFRNHGISTDHRQREKIGSWFYEMEDLGFNYRLTDFQCALGMSQLKKLPSWIIERQKIAKVYDDAFVGNEFISPLKANKKISHAYHLYVIRIKFSLLKIKRSELFLKLKKAGIGVNVHYIPVHLHPFYRKEHNTSIGQCPNAELVYKEILSLPIYPGIGNQNIQKVISTLESLIKFSIK